MDAPIANLNLVEVAPNGARSPIRIEVGPPRPDGRRAWACTVRIDQARAVFAEDSLQALCLGLRLVRAHIQGVLERGSRLVHSDDDSEFRLDAYFENPSDGDARSSG